MGLFPSLANCDIGLRGLVYESSMVKTKLYAEANRHIILDAWDSLGSTTVNLLGCIMAYGSKFESPHHLFFPINDTVR